MLVNSMKEKSSCASYLECLPQSTVQSILFKGFFYGWDDLASLKSTTTWPLQQENDS